MRSSGGKGEETTVEVGEEICTKNKLTLIFRLYPAFSFFFFSSSYGEDR